MNKKIIFSTGGTGGHIFPALNLMKHFFEKGYDVLLVTDYRGNNFIKNYSQFKSYTLNINTPSNKNFIKNFFSFFTILFSIIKSIFILKKEKPDLIFGLGGYVSFPISVASKIFNLPLLLYENNLVLGRSNRYLLAFSKKILIAKNAIKNFPRKYENKISEVGYVLNKKIINYKFSKDDKNNDNFSILVLGGSQGAEIFGNIIPKVVNMIKNKGYAISISQQCIDKQKNILSDFYDKNGIINYVFKFDENTIKLFSNSDLAITRCGASTIAELTHSLTPFIAVPLPNSINNHQYLNAKFYEENGCCFLLEQKNFTTENLFNLVVKTIEDKNRLKKIRENMKKYYSNDVYIKIENEIKNFI